MKKTQIGVVVSNKMQDTAVIEVTLWKVHPIIKKRYKRHHKFMAHNPGNVFKSGETVEISETRPMSRNKRWEIVRKIDKSAPEKTEAPKKEAKKKTTKK